MKRAAEGSFPPAARLRSKGDFHRVQSLGKRLYARHFLLVTAEAEFDQSRLGITVTKKVEARAVFRNRLKRRLREIFRTTRSRFVRPLDIIVIARREAAGCDLAEIRREILGTLNREGLLKPAES